jgi:hypothetical protein
MKVGLHPDNAYRVPDIGNLSSDELSVWMQNWPIWKDDNILDIVNGNRAAAQDLRYAMRAVVGTFQPHGDISDFLAPFAVTRESEYVICGTAYPSAHAAAFCFAASSVRFLEQSSQLIFESESSGNAWDPSKLKVRWQPYLDASAVLPGAMDFERCRLAKPRIHIPEDPIIPDRSVTLNQVADYLSGITTKRALDTLRQAGKLPEPSKRRQGRAGDLFLWSQLRPALVAEHGESAIPIAPPPPPKK